MNELIKIEKNNALEIFTSKGLNIILQKIEKSAINFIADISNTNGRKDIASMAHKVSKVKVDIDNVGKELVSDWTKRTRQVNESRKYARDFLDDLRDRVRKPLTDWEEKERKKEEAIQLAKEILQAHEEAIIANELLKREARIKCREIELEKQEEKRLKELRQKQEESDKIERELRIAQEAKEKAEREAQENIEYEKHIRIKAENARIESELRAKIEKEQAEKQKKEEIELAKTQERKRLEAIEYKKKEEEKKRAANIQHQEKINNEILEDLVNEGIDKNLSLKIISLIKEHKIRHIYINY